MNVVLGIDTGGTYTDGVLVDVKTKRILAKAKARTTKENLAIGIKECITNLNLHEKYIIKMIALSTTLATNATVEGKGGEVGAILIGKEPLNRIPTNNYVVIKGGHDVDGKEIMELDEDSIINVLETFKGKVDAIAVSSFLSIRNPQHELRTKELIHKELGLPVVCAHQLSNTLGFYERTVTSIINAKLLPIIAELVDSVNHVLQRRKINAEIMIVKSNGSLASVNVIKDRPVETILSGPSASIIGAASLTKLNNAIILDMGGTTTDIAYIKNNEPEINDEGALVAGWRTRVKAVEVFTVGLGGDSSIRISGSDKVVKVGPNRVLPLCFAAKKYPHLIDELKTIQSQKISSITQNQMTDCFIIQKGNSVRNLSDTDQIILELLKDKPHSLWYLSQQLGMAPDFFPYRNLVNAGAIAHISFTPTDALHVIGDLDNWDTKAAFLGLKLLSIQYGVDERELISKIVEAVVNSMSATIIQSLITFEDKNYPVSASLENIFAEKILKNRRDRLFSCTLNVREPVIGIGAPVGSWLPKVKDRLSVEIVIPEHAEVANAYGAAIGKIIERSEVLIKPFKLGGYGVYLPWGFTILDDLDEAKEYIEKSLKNWVYHNAVKAGAFEPKVDYTLKEVYAKSYNVDTLIEVRVFCNATGEPKAIKV